MYELSASEIGCHVTLQVVCCQKSSNRNWIFMCQWSSGVSKLAGFGAKIIEWKLSWLHNFSLNGVILINETGKIHEMSSIVSWGFFITICHTLLPMMDKLLKVNRKEHHIVSLQSDPDLPPVWFKQMPTKLLFPFWENQKLHDWTNMVNMVKDGDI